MLPQIVVVDTVERGRINSLGPHDGMQNRKNLYNHHICANICIQVEI